MSAELFRSGGLASPKVRWSLFGLAVFLLLWTLLAALLGSPRRYPGPVVLIAQAGEIFGEPRFFRALLTSVRRVMLGFLVGSSFGVVSALLVGLWRALGVAVDPLVELLRPIPALGVLPIFLVIFGVGEALPVSVVAYIAFFPAYIATLDALRGVEATHIEAARTLGAGRWSTIRGVLMPAAAPRIFAGLRIGMALSWMSIIGAEMVGTTSGIGFSIMYFRQFAQIEKILMGMLLIGLAGAFLDFLMRSVEAAASPWLRVRE